MSMAYIRERYGVPAQRGGRVVYLHKNKKGTITGSCGGYLRIRLDGEKHSGLYHPTWKLNYEEDIGEASDTEARGATRSDSSRSVSRASRGARGGKAR